MKIDYLQVALIALIAGACWTLGAWIVTRILSRAVRPQTP